MVNVKHHDCNVRVLIVELSTLVHELCLHLDDAVEGLVGDKGLVADVKLQQGSRMGTVDHGMVFPSPGAGISQVQELAPVKLEAVCSCRSKLECGNQTLRYALTGNDRARNQEQNQRDTENQKEKQPG